MQGLFRHARNGHRHRNVLVRIGVVLALVLTGLIGVIAGGAPANAAAPSTLTWSTPKQALLARRGGLTGISCPSSTWCLAVDQNGNYQTGARGKWTPATRAVDGVAFRAVSCPSTTFCLATDDTGRVFPYRNGTWNKPTKVFADAAAEANSIDCVSISFCLAVDESGFVSRWNGSAWGTIINPNSSPANSNSHPAVTCASTTLCIVTSDVTPQRYDGAKLTSIDPDSNLQGSASCIRGGTCLLISSVFGDPDASATYRLAGNTWVLQADDAPFYTNDFACASVTRCVAGGREYNGFAGYTFDGKSWHETEIAPASAEPGTGGVHSDLSCTANLALCEVINYTQETWIAAGGTWASATQIDPANSTVESLSCVSSAICVLAGDHLVTRYSGGTWSKATTVTQDYGTIEFNPDDVTDASCGSSTFCALGGYRVDDADGSSPELFETDGRTVTKVRPTTGARYVSCPTASFCGGITRTRNIDRTVATTYSNGTWSDLKTLADGPTSSISCVSSTFCIAVGSDADGAAFYRYDGSTWTLTRAAIAGNQTAEVSCASTTFCVATSTDGFASTYNGTRWSAPKRVTTSLGEIDCASTTFCVASANVGQVVELHGTSWASPVTVSDVRVADVSCPTTKFCAAADTDGDVVFGTPKKTIDS